MDRQEEPRSIRRRIMRNSIFIFVGFVLIVLCFVFLGIAQQRQHITSGHCSDCNSKNTPKIFRLLAAICFVVGSTIMTIFWWHIRAMRSSLIMRQRHIDLEGLLANHNQTGRRTCRASLGKRNCGWKLIKTVVDVGERDENHTCIILNVRDVNHPIGYYLMYACLHIFRCGYYKNVSQACLLWFRPLRSSIGSSQCISIT